MTALPYAEENMMIC